MHLNQLRAVPVSPVQGCVQRGHRAAFAGPQNGVDSRAVVQEKLARVQVTVQGRDVKGSLAVLSSDVQRARSLFRQPLDQLDPAGRRGLVPDPRASDGSRVKRTTVLRENLQGLQLTLGRGAERGSERRDR